MKLKQRALALMLSMMMVLTFMPALAFADSTASGVKQVNFDVYMENVLLVNSDNMLYPSYPRVEVLYDDGRTEYPWIEIKDIAFADSSFGTITKYDGESEDYSGWIATPVKTGKADIEFTFAYGNDPTKEFEYKYTKTVAIAKKIEKIYVKTEGDDRRALPGDTVALHAEMSYEDEDYEVPENLTYEWSIDDYAVQKGCTITGSGADAEVVISDNYDDSDIDVMVIAYDGKELYSACREYLEVDDDIYKLFCDGLREDFLPGETITFTPVVKYRSTTDREWREVSDYRGVSDITIDVYTDYYNEETGEQEEKASESDTLKIEKNSDGSYTLTRKKPGYAYLTVEACYSDDEGELNEFDSYRIQFEYYDEYVELECDENLYNGGSITVPAYCDQSGNYDYVFKVYKITGLAPGEEGDITYAYEEMDNSGNKYFTSNGNKVTLDGTAIWNDVKDGYISPDSDTPQIKLEVSLVINGIIISKDSTHIIVQDAGKRYGQLEDDRTLMLEHVTEYFVDDEENTGYIYDADHPYGDEFSYVITNVTSSNTKAIKVYKENSEAWAVEAVGVGTATVTFTVKDEFGETAKVPVTFKAVTDEYEIELIKGSGCVLPGESVILEAEGEHDNYQEYGLNDFSFKWDFEGGEKYVESTENLTANGSKIKVNIKKDISAEELDEYIEICGRVYIVDKDGNVQEDVWDEFDIEVAGSYYIYKPAEEDVPSRPDINEKLEFKPEVIRRSLVDGEPKDQDVTGFFWTVQYDQDDMVIRDSSGKKVLPDEYYYEDEEDLVYNQGNFTVERLTPDYCGFSVYFYEYDKEDDEEDGYYYTIGGSSYSFEEFTPMEDCYAVKISNKTYTGKAITQSPVVYYEDDKLVLNKDYKISYKNNKNVGTATIYFTGMGDFRGTLKKTFKINPKGTALSKVTAGSKSFTAIWKKQATQTTGYQIQYGLKSNFKGAKTATVKKNKTVKTTIKKLKSKKTYYVRIRTYKTVSGKNYYSSWSKAKKVKVK